MQTCIKFFCAALLGWAMTSAEAGAMDRASQARALAGELPAALRAIQVRPHEVLTVHEATKVRGQWVATLNLPYFATQIQGYQPFTIQLWTIGEGIAPGTPVYIRLTIGR